MFTSWEDAEQSFDDMLDESSGPVVIAGIEFRAAQVLKEVDPIAYRTSLFDYVDGEGIDSDDLDGEPSI